MLKISISRTPKKGEPTSIRVAIECLQALVFCHGCVALWGLIRLFTHPHPIWILPYATMLAAIVLIVLPFIVTYWLTNNMKQAKGWARLTYTILAALSFVVSPLLGISTSSFIYLLSTTLSLRALFSLYQKDSNEWFKQASQPHASPIEERESA